MNEIPDGRTPEDTQPKLTIFLEGGYIDGATYIGPDKLERLYDLRGLRDQEDIRVIHSDNTGRQRRGRTGYVVTLGPRADGNYKLHNSLKKLIALARRTK